MKFERPGKAMGDRVVVRIILDEKIKKLQQSAIHLTELNYDKLYCTSNYGQVIGIGSGAFKENDGTTDKDWFKVGDYVLLAQSQGVNDVDPDTGDVYRVLYYRDVVYVYPKVKEEENV